MPRLSTSEKLNKNNKNTPMLENQESEQNTQSNSAGKKMQVSPEERQRMIQETAFYLAEREGFSSDNQIYWLRAEEQIDKMING